MLFALLVTVKRAECDYFMMQTKASNFRVPVVDTGLHISCWEILIDSLGFAW